MQIHLLTIYLLTYPCALQSKPGSRRRPLALNKTSFMPKASEAVALAVQCGSPCGCAVRLERWRMNVGGST